MHRALQVVTPVARQVLAFITLSLKTVVNPCPPRLTKCQ